MQTNRDFPPLGHCLQTLGVLISAGNVNGIGLAEKAIDEFLRRQDDLNVRTGDLHILEQELEKIWKTSTGPSLEFVNLVFDYLAAKLRELQPEHG